MTAVSTPGAAGAQPPVPVDLVTLTIDGQEVSVPKGTLVIRAAEQIGIEIPRFCDHPLLEPVGACRQCLVEVALPGPDGTPRTMMGPPGRVKPQASCTLTASQGMVVNTQISSPIADKAQHGVMEQLLINHPLDCPVCDKGGECPLQNQALTRGAPESRFSAGGGVKRTFLKPIPISPAILLDRERCIVCQRCTRFASEIAGDPFIALVERGAQQQIGTAEGVPFGSYFSGNTIQICPVGALTSTDYRFRARPFDLVSTPSIADHDSSGAAIRVDHRRGKVVRRLAGNDPEVNEEWITDKDRFAFHHSTRPDRLTTPLILEDGKHRPASWPEALAVAAAGLKRAAASGAVGVVAGGRLPIEDSYAYSKFARVVLGTNNVDFRTRPVTEGSTEEADFLAALVAATPVEVTFSALERAKQVVLVGLEPEDEAGIVFLRLRKAAGKGTKVVAISSHATRGLQKLGGTLVATVPGEEGAAIAGLDLDADTIVLAGERLATAPGAYSAVAASVAKVGARLAWVPRRAGDRGAVDAGMLPSLLPGGRPVADAQARVDVGAAWGVDLPATPGLDVNGMVAALADGRLTGLVLGGTQFSDTVQQSRMPIFVKGDDTFVVALEVGVRHAALYADVVLPIAPAVEKSGTFVNWEGRHRPFPKVLTESNAMSDVRVLAELAAEMGTPLGFETSEAAYAELAQLGAWDGARAAAPTVEPAVAPSGVRLATWREMIDGAELLKGEDMLLETARASAALVSQRTYDAHGLGETVRISTDAGSLTFPVEVADLPDDVVWAPTYAAQHVTRVLGATHGSVVAIADGGQA